MRVKLFKDGELSQDYTRVVNVQFLNNNNSLRLFFKDGALVIRNFSDFVVSIKSR